MDITAEIIGNILIVTVNTPNATVENAAQFNSVVDSLFAVENNNIIVDMSCVKYMDSTFLGQAVKYLKAARKAGGDLKLVACEGCGDHPIWVLFELTRTSDIFSIYENLDEAIKSFSDAH